MLNKKIASKGMTSKTKILNKKIKQMIFKINKTIHHNSVAFRGA